MEIKDVIKGAFGASLIRSNSKIKAERALSIWKMAQRVYLRKVEDLQMSIEDLQIQREARLDMSPDNSQSLTIAKDFDAEEFYKQDLDITLKIREVTIKFEEAKARYDLLFGEPISVATDPVTVKTN